MTGSPVLLWRRYVFTFANQQVKRELGVVWRRVETMGGLAMMRVEAKRSTQHTLRSPRSGIEQGMQLGCHGAPRVTAAIK